MGLRVVWDKEAKNLLNSQSIDYNASPFKLRDPEFVHCTGFVDLNSDSEWMFGPEEVRKHRHAEFIMEEVDEMIGHNTINYDHLLMKLDTGMDYQIGCSKLDIPDRIIYKGKSKDIIITDTLVMSKTLNPDRPQHSIAYYGSILGLEKIDWRAKAIELGLIEVGAPKGAEFRQWHPEMGIYMMRDCHVNVRVYNHLIREWGTWEWDDAYELEKAVAEIITRQEHRGFWFDRAKAVEHVKFLDAKMEELRQTVEPLIPPKPLTQADLKDVTPLKVQFLKKTGEPVANILKFAKKHGSEFVEIDGVWTAEMYGKIYTLPMPHEPMYTTKPAKLDDTLHIKEWLVKLGWKPAQYKERDLTVDSKKKKISKEKFDIAVEKWVEQTFDSPFKKDRLFELDYTERVAKEQVLNKLKRHEHMKRPLIVYTNPTLTVGMEKTIDPALLELSSQFAHASEISDYLTYKHRRNSILGGGIDPDDDEDMQKGWLSDERILEDGRIGTPADTCGAATSRFKHRKVANIPRVSSKFGKEMRELFGVDGGCYQMGYDFDSLEAKIESHYVFRYEGGPAYGVSLTAEKPNDCHTVLAGQITDLLGRPFPRATAKNVKYGCVPVDNTEVLTPTGWVRYADLEIGSIILAFDGSNLVSDKVERVWHYENADVYSFGHSRWNVECTNDHRWIGKRKYSSDKDEFFETGELQTNFAVRVSAPYAEPPRGVTPEEAALVAWLLSDGYYKWSDKVGGTSNSGGKKQGIVASIAQASHKYQKALKDVLTANGMDWEETDLGSVNANTNTSYRLKATQIRPFMDRVVGNRMQKHDTDWCEWVLKLNPESRESFLHHFWLADGSTTVKGSMVIKQNRGKIADAVVLAGQLTGSRVFQSGEKCSVIRIVKNPYVGMQTGKVAYSRETDVFCLSTGTGTFVIRQGDVVTITGNCSYNAQVARVAKTVGCTMEEAQIIFDAFWEQAFPLKQLKEAMQAYWEHTGGKKFLIGIDKRKLPIRSKGNVINTAFQSAGVICAKRAMVFHDRYLKAEGLTMDFFIDDWKARSENYCQQLIAYHDEAQNEVNKKSVEFKVFKFEGPLEALNEKGKMEMTPEAKAAETAVKAFKAAQTDKVWSDVGHTDKCFYVAYNRAGELATKAVTESGKYYKLNVELTAGYIIGTNWASCH